MASGADSCRGDHVEPSENSQHQTAKAHCGLAEHEAQTRGMTRLVLLTTRTGAWFEERGYLFSGPAFSSTHLPPSRRAQVVTAHQKVLT